jgi:hypothetical protein
MTIGDQVRVNETGQLGEVVDVAAGDSAGPIIWVKIHGQMFNPDPEGSTTPYSPALDRRPFREHQLTVIT